MLREEHDLYPSGVVAAANNEPTLDGETFAMLLGEQDHRTQNVLQMIICCLSREAGKAEGNTALTLERAVAQVQSFALLNQAISVQSNNGQQTPCCATFLRQLCAHVEAACYRDLDMRLQFSAPARLHLDERSCRHIGLALIETLLNAAKHAYGRDGGQVDVIVDETATEVRVTITDGGKGLPPSKRSGRQGLGLIEYLMRSVAGSASYTRLEPGTRVRLTVPRLEQQSPAFTAGVGA